MDPDPDPSLFIIDLQDVNEDKKSKNCRNQGFSYYFCLMIEGSGSGSLWPKTCGSGGSGSGTLHPGMATCCCTAQKAASAAQLL
jgi:hypothetical protein